MKYNWLEADLKSYMTPKGSKTIMLLMWVYLK